MTLPVRASLAFVFVLSACGPTILTRETTPWLRARHQCHHDPLSFLMPMAESGGSNATTSMERYRAGRWETIPDGGTEGIVLSRGSRVVLERWGPTRAQSGVVRLLTAEGRDVPLACGGALDTIEEVRITPHGEILCVEHELATADAPSRGRSSITAFDADGRRLRRQHAIHPIRSSGATVVDWRFLGFAAGDLVFVAQVGSRRSPRDGDACHAYALDRRDNWRLLGTLETGARTTERCADEPGWSARLGLAITPGRSLENLAPLESCEADVADGPHDPALEPPLRQDTPV